MGNSSKLLSAAHAQWKTPATLMLLATLAVPAWYATTQAPLSAALIESPAIFTPLEADSVIVYAAPADADPILRISSRNVDGQWEESELQLSNAEPLQSAALVKAAVAREMSILAAQ